MNFYQKPKNRFLQNYRFPVHLQGSAAPITPDCQQESTACGVSDLGYSCTNGSDWLIKFELVNANCSDVPNPLVDLNCQIIESSGGQVVLQGCQLDQACSEAGCNDSAVYQVLCLASSNQQSCSFNDVISISCAQNDFENCSNNNSQPSDIRLKQNIRATGGTVGGFNEYTWEWNDTAKSLKLDHYPARGVLAQEVLEKKPSAVVFDSGMGYYRVKYSAL